MLDYDQLISELERLCVERRTGTLFITTWDNRSARFVISNGEILSCSYSIKRGRDAIPLLRGMKAGSYKFAEEMFSSMDEAPLPPTAELLADLAGARPAHVPVEKKGWIATETTRTIKTELARFMGPIADILCEDYLAVHGTVENPEQAARMTQALSARIGEITKRLEFVKRVQARLEGNKPE